MYFSCLYKLSEIVRALTGSRYENTIDTVRIPLEGSQDTPIIGRNRGRPLSKASLLDDRFQMASIRFWLPVQYLKMGGWRLRYGSFHLGGWCGDKDFKCRLRVEFNSEIVTGFLPSLAIGSIGYTWIAFRLRRRNNWYCNRKKRIDTIHYVSTGILSHFRLTLRVSYSRHPWGFPFCP